MNIPLQEERPLLEIKQVSLALNGCTVLRDVQFSMQAGDWVAIDIQDRQAGDALTRLISREYEPSGGKVFFMGTLLQQWQGQELMCRRCILPSRWCSPLRGTLTEVVEQGMVLANGETRHSAGRELLGLFGLLELADELYVEQPEKVRQLALLARVLGQVWYHAGPKLVVIDQGLSALTAQEMNALLGRLKRFLRHRDIACLVLLDGGSDVSDWPDQQWRLSQRRLHRLPAAESAPPDQWWRFWA